MKKRQTIILLGLIGAMVLGVGMIWFLTASPRQRTVVVDAAAAKRTVPVDEGAATAAFEAQVEKYRAAGDPVRAQELAPAAVAAEKDAGPVFEEAAAMLDRFGTAHRTYAFFDLDVTATMPPEKWKIVETAVERDLAGELAKVDEATTRPACNWNVKYLSPVIYTLLLHLNGMRGLANVVQPAALLAHRNGRDDEALRRTGQLLAMARDVDQRPFMVTHLVALGISRMASDTASAIVPTLKIGNGPGEARADQVRALYADFLQDEWAGDGLAFTMKAERLSILDTARCLATKKLTTAKLTKLISSKSNWPMDELTPGEAYADALPMMRFMDPLIEAAKTARRLGQFQAKIPTAAPQPPSVMGAVMPTFDRFPVTHYTAVSRLHQAGTALAVRLWMAEHGGAPPAALGDLVPKYLEAIPLDPLSPTDGGTLTYQAAPVAMIVGESARPQDRMQMRVGGRN